VFNLTGQPMSDGIRSHRLGPPLLVALLAAVPVQAQIVTDGTVSHKVSLSGPQMNIGADLGVRVGDNLFHSFEKFGIASGQTATFTGPQSIKNVISRVTGGEVSLINGTLRSTVGQADLYFLNPAGVVFGPNARLDVPGSFYVSTEHELRLADGTLFSAADKAGSGLSVAPPEAFGFLDRSPRLPELIIFNQSHSLDTGSQLREACAARGGRPASSFAAGGRGGLPPDPGTPLAASPFEQSMEQQTATGSPTALTTKPWKAAKPKPITVAGIPQPVLGSPRLMCRG
jgi:filamentous hemagglutinin family protein